MIALPSSQKRATTGEEQARAIARGEAALDEWLQLLERGTDEQIAAELCWRGVRITADVQASRAVSEALGWKEPAA